MSLATYTDLTNAITDWLARNGDTSLVGRSADFVSLCEQRITYGSKGGPIESPPLRVRYMENLAAGLVTVGGTETVALPSDYLAVRRFQVVASPNATLVYRTPTQFDDEYPDSTYTDQPEGYTIEGSNFRLGPVPDTAYPLNLLYYGRIPSLQANTTNWLMTQFPAVYLYGALLEAAIYRNDSDRIAQMAALYASATSAMQQQDDEDRHSGAALTMRSDAGNP